MSIRGLTSDLKQYNYIVNLSKKNHINQGLSGLQCFVWTNDEEEIKSFKIYYYLQDKKEMLRYGVSCDLSTTVRLTV